MYSVTLTFEVWIQVKITAHYINEDNICTKLDDNPSMHTEVIERTRNVTDGQTDGQTDEVHSYNPLTTPWRGINKSRRLINTGNSVYTQLTFIIAILSFSKRRKKTARNQVYIYRKRSM